MYRLVVLLALIPSVQLLANAEQDIFYRMEAMYKNASLIALNQLPNQFTSVSGSCAEKADEGNPYRISDAAKCGFSYTRHDDSVLGYSYLLAVFQGNGLVYGSYNLGDTSDGLSASKQQSWNDFSLSVRQTTQDGKTLFVVFQNHHRSDGPRFQSYCWFN